MTATARRVPDPFLVEKFLRAADRHYLETAMTDLYTSLPAELRGSHLEGRAGFPLSWEGSSEEEAHEVFVILCKVIALGGLEAHLRPILDAERITVERVE